MRGFTLLELIVVLVVIGVLVGVSLPSFVSRPAPLAADSARTVARRRAALSGRPEVVTGDSGVVRVLPDGRVLMHRGVLLTDGN
jgi:prepilin-type N-terminal cleavage/methylation domain-containing protein